MRTLIAVSFLLLAGCGVNAAGPTAVEAPPTTLAPPVPIASVVPAFMAPPSVGGYEGVIAVFAGVHLEARVKNLTDHVQRIGLGGYQFKSDGSLRLQSWDYLEVPPDGQWHGGAQEGKLLVTIPVPPCAWRAYLTTETLDPGHPPASAIATMERTDTPPCPAP